MDKIEIPQDLVVPLESIAPGLAGLRIAFVNVFGVTHPDGSWTLIDAAIPHTSALIRSWAEKTYNRPPNAVVLTHGHFDHVGDAKPWPLSGISPSTPTPSSSPTSPARGNTRIPTGRPAAAA